MIPFKIFKTRFFRRKNRPSPKIKIISDAGRQVFFGYYDITPFSYDERFLLSVHAPYRNLPPEPGAEVLVGYYDLNDDALSFFEIGKTTTWCWQQGCRLQWHPEKSNRMVLYNRLVDGQYGCVIQDIESNEAIKTYKRPIYAVSKNGRWGLSLNFSRLHRLRPGYGYAELPDDTEGQPAPEADGIWRMDMKTGKEDFLFSIAEITHFEPLESMKGAEHYFNHILFNPNETRFMFFHVWLNDGKRFIRLITCNFDGKDLYPLINEGHVSHYTWKSNDELLAYSTHKDTGRHYHLYKDKSADRKVIGEGVLNQDGHPSYSPDSSLLLTDTYPDKYRDQHLLIYKLETGELCKIGAFYTPPDLKGEVRCDLHPRWSPSGRFICFDSAHEGRRKMYLVDVRDGI